MSADPHVLVVGRAEIPTTATGELCFQGAAFAPADLTSMRWAEEGTHPLHGALYGGHPSLAMQLLQAGSPVDDAAYAIALDHCIAALEALPARPDLVRRLRDERRLPALARAILSDQPEDVQRLLAEGPVAVDHPVLITHGYGALCLIHYAALRANPTVLAALLRAGADARTLTPQGWSPRRIVLAQRAVDRGQRRACDALLADAGGAIMPPLRLGERVARWLGIPLEPTPDPAG